MRLEVFRGITLGKPFTDGTQSVEHEDCGEKESADIHITVILLYHQSSQTPRNPASTGVER